MKYINCKTPKTKRISHSHGNIQFSKHISLKRRYNVMRSEPNNLEIVSKHTSKGDALITLAKKLNIDIEETISFGDSDNDSSMIKVSGMGVAMGNASEDIKAIADIVTDSNNNDGLAKAIEHIISLD